MTASKVCNTRLTCVWHIWGRCVLWKLYIDMSLVTFNSFCQCTLSFDLFHSHKAGKTLLTITKRSSFWSSIGRSTSYASSKSWAYRSSSVYRRSWKKTLVFVLEEGVVWKEMGGLDATIHFPISPWFTNSIHYLLPAWNSPQLRNVLHLSMFSVLINTHSPLICLLVLYPWRPNELFCSWKMPK